MPRIDPTDKYTFRVLWSDEDNEFVAGSRPVVEPRPADRLPR